MYNEGLALMEKMYRELKTEFENNVFERYVEQCEKYNDYHEDRYIDVMEALKELAGDMGYTIIYEVKDNKICYADIRLKTTDDILQCYYFNGEGEGE